MTVRKRRFFPKKRRVSGAKTSFFDPKDFVFFRKNGIFSSVDFFFVILKVSFMLKSLRISEKFTQAHSFHILISTLKAMIYILLTSQYKSVASYRDFENKIGTSFSRSQPSRNGGSLFPWHVYFNESFNIRRRLVILTSLTEPSKSRLKRLSCGYSCFILFSTPLLMI